MTAEEWSIDNPEYAFFEEEISQGMLDEIMKFANDYLNSQRDTIFKDELEKRLPSEDEIYKQAALECNPFLPDSAKWLIQYLKK